MRLILSLLFLLIFSANIVLALPALIESKVARVIDGDTIQIDVAGSKEQVRLIGVDTPETKHPKKGIQSFGPEAFEFTKTTLYEGRVIWLEFDVGQRDRYQRLLAYVWLKEPLANTDQEIRSKMFNAQLLLSGYSRLMTIPPNVRYVDYFRNYQIEARINKHGLWYDYKI